MKTNNPISYILFLCACISFMSCSDDNTEGVLSPLDAPVVTISERTSSSIAFKWEAVQGARQYGYRVTDLSGDNIYAGVTKTRSFEAPDLMPFTTYTVAVTAFPTVTGTAAASETVLNVPTLFYDPVENCQTAYVSHLQANRATVTNYGTISEDRSGEDYVENNYGVFTISKFCGAAGHDMIFIVNRDNTITILNGERLKDENGNDSRIVALTTGKSSSATLSFDKIYIDEFSSHFDGPNGTLTFAAKNNGEGDKLRESDTETITWQ